MSTELTRYQPSGDMMRLSLSETMELGKVLAQTGYFKDARDAGQCVARILYGRELGIGPMASMMGVHIIEGKPSPSANLMATLMKRSTRYNYRIAEWTDQVCTIVFYEHGEECGTASFSMKEAQAAGVGGKDVWRRYPKAMLFSRALSQGARAYCADVFGGAPVYSAEELGAPVDVLDTGEIVPAPSAPQGAETAQEPPQVAARPNAPHATVEVLPAPAAPR